LVNGRDGKLNPSASVLNLVASLILGRRAGDGAPAQWNESHMKMSRLALIALLALPLGGCVADIGLPILPD
jgi:hypothetical protein